MDFVKIKKRIKLLFILSVILGITAIVMDKIVMPIYTRHGDETQMPEVVEKTYQEARAFLLEKGYKPVLEEERFDPNTPKGYVISQNPTAFSTVKTGRRVYLVVSAGEKYIIVPNFIGISEREAQFRVQEAGMILQETYFDYNPNYPRGVVMRQSIPENSEVKKESEMALTVSLGEKPSEFRAPDVVGKSLETAKDIIIKAGLEVGEITLKHDEKLLPNTVMKQSIKPNTKVDEKTKIDLIVSGIEDETEDPTSEE